MTVDLQRPAARHMGSGSALRGPAIPDGERSDAALAMLSWTFSVGLAGGLLFAVSSGLGFGSLVLVGAVAIGSALLSFDR